MKKFNWLGLWFVIGVAAVMLVGFATIGNCTSITFENCEPGTWVGGVKWEWKDGVRGAYLGSTYVDIPEIELKGTGSLVVDLAPGDYAITHYRPAMTGVTAEGRGFFIPATVLEFKEIEVKNSPATYSFGCDFAVPHILDD